MSEAHRPHAVRVCVATLVFEELGGGGETAPTRVLSGGHTALPAQMYPEQAPELLT
jgi:hypothetical protein